MADEPKHQVTELLAGIGRGDRRASEALLPLVYGELRKLARAKMARERPGQTLQATALVHEAYLRLLGGTDLGWDNRGHFFAAAAEAMRRILIERARRYSREKHAGGLRRVSFEQVDLAGEERDLEELLELDRALDRLEAQDARMAQVVKLRYFAGLTVEETAQALDTAPRTVNRLWTAAKSWLHRELGRSHETD